jgi:hypothetical protein
MIHLEDRNAQNFINGYIEAALWSSTCQEFDEDSGQTIDVPVDRNHDKDDLTDDSMQLIVEDCLRFMRENARDIERATLSPRVNNYTYASAGHDFLLTRNRHGAGFWDRGFSKQLGDALTAAAHSYGESFVVVTAGGKVHFA